MPENKTFKKWQGHNVPQRVLFIRLQALGDVMITLPYIQGFKRNFPDATIHFLTREEVAQIPYTIDLFDYVYELKGKRKPWKQAFNALWQFPNLYKNKYDVVIDLQNNWISRLVRKILNPKGWSAFDRFSPFSAGERTANAINLIGLGDVHPDFHFRLKDESMGTDLLIKNGWEPDNQLVILNPAGVFESRNWPLDYYARFARLWLERFPNTVFVISGLDRISEKANYLQEQLGDKLINLVGTSSQLEVFAIIQKTTLMVSEDSGLMHMAWVSGVSTIALFGSSRSDWSRPLGEHSVCLNSSDLECGECMQAQCKFGDVHCLTRFSPEFVFEEALKLLKRKLA